MTKQEAIDLFKTQWWESATDAEAATFQLNVPRLCMPFDEFHRCVEATLGRPVYTHEIGFNREGLIAEVAGERPPPTLQDIINMIPEEKRIIIRT